MVKNTIPGWILVLILVASPAMAALVNYLSNTITFSFRVESPIHLTIISPANGDIGEITGGSNFTVSYKVENRANNNINGVEEVVLCGIEPLTGDEFASAEYSVNGISYKPLRKVDPTIAGNIQQPCLIYHTDPMTYRGGSESIHYLRFKLKTSMQPGQYKLSVRVVPPS